MAHLLEIVNDQAKMAWAGEVPWHGLGKKVPADLSTDQMLEAAQLNYTVKKYPALSIIPYVDPLTKEEKKKVIKTGWNSLIRETDNQLIDIVSDDWQIVQNKEAFDFFHEFVMAGDMQMHTAGSISDGQIIWALAKINDSFELFKGDVVDSYLLFTNFHKYGFSTDIRFTPIRVVCNNTLTLALNNKGDRVVKISHRKKFNPGEAKEILGIATDKLKKYKEMAEFLGSRRAKNEDIVTYFKRIFPHSRAKTDPTFNEPSTNASHAMQILNSQPGSEYAAGSWWQPFNSVTFMTDHIIGRTTENRLASSWYGLNRTLKTKALEIAVEMANAS